MTDLRCASSASSRRPESFGLPNRHLLIVFQSNLLHVQRSEWMVRHGHAIAYRRYSHAYVAAEDEARRERRELWAGTFVAPEQFRSRVRRVTRREPG